MDSEQIQQALAPFLEGDHLLSPQVTAISKYLEVLLRWNSRMNLTSVRTPTQILTRHFGESLFAARKLFPEASSNATLMDVGSGAGFPGLPISIYRPKLEVTLVEAHGRKATFLREVVRLTGIENVTVAAERAEKLSLTADIVTLRAVEDFRAMVRICAGMVGTEGRLAIFAGPSQVAEIAAFTMKDWDLSEPVYFLDSSRALLVLKRLPL